MDHVTGRKKLSLKEQQLTGSSLNVNLKKDHFPDEYVGNMTTFTVIDRNNAYQIVRDYVQTVIQ